MNTLLEDNFSGFQHLGIPVTDISQSITYYSRLGFRKAMEKTFNQDTGEVTAIMMARGTSVIELYQLPINERAEISNRSDGHIDHMAFSVIDIDVAFSELSNAGLEIIEDSPVELEFWDRGCRYFTVRGPDGEKLEFNQRL